MTQFNFQEHNPLYRPGMAQAIHGFASKLEWDWYNAFNIAGWQPEYIGDCCTWADFRFAGVNFFVEIKPAGEQFHDAAISRIPREAFQHLLICQGRPPRCYVSLSFVDSKSQSRRVQRMEWRSSPQWWSYPPRNILQVAAQIERVAAGGNPLYVLGTSPLGWCEEEPPIELSGMQCQRCGEDIMLADAKPIGEFQLCDYCNQPRD